MWQFCHGFYYPRKYALDKLHYQIGSANTKISKLPSLPLPPRLFPCKLITTGIRFTRSRKCWSVKYLKLSAIISTCLLSALQARVIFALLLVDRFSVGLTIISELFVSLPRQFTFRACSISFCVYSLVFAYSILFHCSMQHRIVHLICIKQCSNLFFQLYIYRWKWFFAWIHVKPRFSINVNMSIFEQFIQYCMLILIIIIKRAIIRTVL